MRIYVALATICLIMLASGCGGPKSSWGFSLPDGDVEQGQATFAELKCNACHTLSGADLPTPEEEPELSIALGGKVSRIRTYGELVTSIINPSHRLAEGYPSELLQTDDQSKMKNYNDVLTIDQLIDLVAFLQSHYELKEFEPTDYPLYY